MAKVIGIDLGTTNSCVAIIEGDEPVVIQDRDGNATTPSIYAISGTQEPLVGYPAQRQAETNRLNTIFAVKRLIGRKFDAPEIVEAGEKLPYKILRADNNDAWVEVNGKPTSPEEVSAQVLVRMKQIAEEYLGETVKQAVITVPAHFNDSQRQATKDAGKIAGLDVLRIINEPTAAALAYGLDGNTDKDMTIAVFDLGGGTFDITILDLKNGVFDVRSTNGDTFLGGEDFDLAIVGHFIREFKKKEGIDLAGDKMVLQRLKEAARKAKHDLSTQSQVMVSLPFICQGDAGASPKHFELSLDRKTLERLIAPLLERLDEPCLTAIEDAGLKAEKIDLVLLVGGMTRMPSVKKQCMKIFGKEPSDAVNPDEAVAIGAAIQAGLLQGLVKGVSLLDVTSLSLGIETQGGMMHRLIERNTKIPALLSEIFTTSAPHQPQISIHILQGESNFAPDNKTLGRFELMGITPAPRGVPKIEVAFEVDVEGILHVSAKDLDTGEEKRVEIFASSGLSDGEIDQLIKDNRTQVPEDKNQGTVGEIKNQLMGAIFQIQFKLDSEGKKFKGQEREHLEESLRSARLTLGSESDVPTLKQALLAVKQASAILDDYLEAA